jgi:hypothetical protein
MGGTPLILRTKQFLQIYSVGEIRVLGSSKARGTRKDLFHVKDQDCCDSVLFDFELRITPMWRPTTEPDVRPSIRPTSLPAMLLSPCLVFGNHKVKQSKLSMRIMWSLVAVSRLCGSTQRNSTGAHGMWRWVGPTTGLDAFAKRKISVLFRYQAPTPRSYRSWPSHCSRVT